MLREVMKERLNVAMQAIYELFETTILEYEEELRRTKVEKERKSEQLPEAILESRSFHKDVQQVLVKSPEVVPSEWQQREEKCLQIKSPTKIEEENIQSCQDWEQLPPHKMVNVGINTISLTDVHLKSEEDKGLSSQFQHTQSVEEKSSHAEADGEHCEESDKIAPLPVVDAMFFPKIDAPTVSLANSECYAPHPANSKPLSFSQCDEAFGKMRSLRPHVRTGQNPAGTHLSCPFCEKTFNFKANLTRHVNIHTGVKPFVCALCGNAFAQSCHLKRHMGTHTSNKRVARQYKKTTPVSVVSAVNSCKPAIPCLFCAKGFTKKAYLERHMRTHTDGIWPRPSVVLTQPN
ncbi:zinc finger protein 846-like isoform X2 [Hippocampus comes]|uniref:zinc finger protein 846-like isoform X2 n=1 Tax=Hippocampus comes TaxID=109280 RepID=UPI00094E7B7C|nr:PREDICTED: zinc finger protein 846-like isoform X2 [Hippocampus comes]